jgi:hypothetical protein
VYVSRAQGGYLWGLKDWIDRSFMRKYGSDLLAGEAGMMPTAAPAGGRSEGAADQQAPPPTFQAAGPDALALLAASKMRCAGCGSKVSAVCGDVRWGE